MSSLSSLISMMPLTLNISINRSLRSLILIFYWTMMNDRFYSWTKVLLILLIVSAMANMIIHHLVDNDLKCAWASVCSIQDVELEHVVEVRPLVHFLWAHFIVHIHDELLLVTQVHASLVNNLNPLPILNQGSRILDDNVNLMRHAPNAQHWGLGGLLEASHDATMASGHCVLAINRHEHKLGTPDCHHAAQHIQEMCYHVENVFDNVLLEHWDDDRCKLDMMPPMHMQMCMSKNELLRCMLPSPAIESA